MGEKNYGALVISLDFELLWGMRDICCPEDPYARQILTGRVIIPQILNLFERHGISATWAVVGMLFTRSRGELEEVSPELRPQYENHKLNPYEELVGISEEDDPLHFASSLIRKIQETKGQEIATHTFSHYYTLERGQTKESFYADISSAIEIARRHEIELKSIVYPRHQRNSEYEAMLLEQGIVCYRGSEKHYAYRMENGSNNNGWHKRLFRLLDSYVNLSGSHLTAWDQIKEPSGLYNVPASRFLRPYSNRLAPLEGIRLNRILKAMQEAAKTNRIFHLWWHPHNFGAFEEKNLANLRKILECFTYLQKQYGMASLNMLDVAEAVRGE